MLSTATPGRRIRTVAVASPSSRPARSVLTAPAEDWLGTVGSGSSPPPPDPYLTLRYAPSPASPEPSRGRLRAPMSVRFAGISPTIWPTWIQLALLIVHSE